jgi:hypothetical protein
LGAWEMKFFAVFIEVNDYQKIKLLLIDFKAALQKEGNVIVFDLEQSNYDFLYNSLIEKARKEEKGR